MSLKKGLGTSTSLHLTVQPARLQPTARLLPEGGVTAEPVIGIEVPPLSSVE
jgi:hypothetical protein